MIPWRFQLPLSCACLQRPKQTIVDWEAVALYRKVRSDPESRADAKTVTARLSHRSARPETRGPLIDEWNDPFDYRTNEDDVAVDLFRPDRYSTEDGDGTCGRRPDIAR